MSELGLLCYLTKNHEGESAHLEILLGTSRVLSLPGEHTVGISGSFLELGPLHGSYEEGLSYKLLTTQNCNVRGSCLWAPNKKI